MPICELHEEVQRIQTSHERELGGIQATMKNVLQNQEILFKQITDLRDNELADLKTSICEIRDMTVNLSRLYGNGWQKQMESRAEAIEENFKDVCTEFRVHITKSEARIAEIDSITWFGRTITDFKNNAAKRVVQIIAAVFILKTFFILTGFLDVRIASGIVTLLNKIFAVN